MIHAEPTTLLPKEKSVEPRARPVGEPCRIYAVNVARSRLPPDREFLDWLSGTGFDSLLLALPPDMGSADVDTLPPIAGAAAAAGLHVQLDLRLDLAGSATRFIRRHPDWFVPITRRAADPREMPQSPAAHRVNLPTLAAAHAFGDAWRAKLRSMSDDGVAGYRCQFADRIPLAVWDELVAALPGLWFSAWTPILSAAEIELLPRDRFAATYNGLAWWDFGQSWFGDEAKRLARIAPVANTVSLPDVADIGVTAPARARRLFGVAANSGNGFILPMGLEYGLPSDPTCPRYGVDDWRLLRREAVLDLSDDVRETNARIAARAKPVSAPVLLSAEDAPVAVLFEPPARLTLANRRLGAAATFDPAAVLPMLNGGCWRFIGEDGRQPGAAPISLAPGEVRGFIGAATVPIVTASSRASHRNSDADLARATEASRVVIEAMEPTVDQGRFAVKRVAGERVAAAADIYADGHGRIAAALQWRAGNEDAWRETPMRLVENDRWAADFLLERVGPWRFRIVAWPDRFGSFRDELIKKRDAGLNVTVELEEGRLLIEKMIRAASDQSNPIVAELRRAGADRLALLTDDATAAWMARIDTRPGQIVSPEMPVVADRRAAVFSSWYELFPRNQTDDPGRHGTFRDVMRRLPAIRDMGFDVVYFPPIHPIGRTNRKGPGNALAAGEGDPGSPYAIGAAEGGHDAIHPPLGTMDDFRELLDAARKNSLEIALDFAIQCSPDHPWLKQHPEWFDWRPDGGLKYAENPPKKYEDIVNVDFYAKGAIPHLWLALRDVVAFWADAGVRIFRVDNPHTKPFSFWEWLIADIRAKWPDTLFLSEAFTRPKVMYRLAKLGFSQSYTYFTWRNEKPEIETYLRELTGLERTKDAAFGNVEDFFRPHFFVNTPDINPIFLQTSDRAGFLIRAALAATLSGLWGMLQGFEFCESAAIPGREEYADSDKYQIRVRPERAPGDIVDEITRLNAIRRANPALQSHLGLMFHPASNGRVLWYRKQSVDRGNVVLIAVSLDPFGPQTTDVDIPLPEWGLGDDAALRVDDLMRGGRDVWVGRHRTITLDPSSLPFGIWRARPLEAA